MQQLLKTNKATYLFDNEKPELVLKASGKFSSVYLAYQLPEKEPVVLKILNHEVARKANGLKNFIKEASFAIHHSNIQKTLDYFSDGVNHFLVKEYIPGVTLAQLIRSGKKYDWKFYTRCIIHLLPIIKTLHEKGIYHCDLRPHNILVAYSYNNKIDLTYPEVYLLDLGLAKTEAESELSNTSPFSLIYSPPEQLLNHYEIVNSSSDLYSLGITLYECIAGVTPFSDENPELVMHLQLNAALDENKKIPPALFEVLKKATSKHKFTLPPSKLSEEELSEKLKLGQMERYHDAAEFKYALTRVLDHAVMAEEHEKSKPWWKKLFS